MTDEAGLRIEVHGRVQGVAFRWHTQRQARALDLRGTVRNRLDGSVLIQAEGPRDRLEILLAWAGHGPDHARVDRAESTWSEPGGKYREFLITG